MENFSKAEAGAVVFNCYAEARSYLAYDNVHLVLECLLRDLMHFAAAQGVDFESCIESARLRYGDDTGFDLGAP